MKELYWLLLYSTGAGACMLAGGLLAMVARFQQRWLEQEVRHFVIALGGGILVGAVAMVLVPEALHTMDYSPWSIVLLIAGGVLFFVLEKALSVRRRSSPQLTGMLLDYLPESLALGGMIASGANTVALLALLIGLQNLPEGFNAFREMQDAGHQRRNTLLFMAALIPLGPLMTLLGFTVLAGADIALSSVLLLASGGILYLIFQDIAPQARLEHHWAPPLGAVMGFSLAMLGTVLTQN